MKYLFILLFFFSIHSYSTGIKEKVLICIDEEKYINKDIIKSDYIFGYIFNNKSADYYYNSVMNNGMYEIDNILNVKYNINENFIIMDLEFGNLFINRKTLEHRFNNSITARCELAKNKKFFFDLLKERKKELNNQIKKNK
tara:strand:- start:1528 stop:1950 length:423 start_codon:yes stop_codon:yes gene_type:complete